LINIKRNIVISILPIIFCGYLFSQDKVQVSLGSGTSNMSNISYKISLGEFYVNTEVKKITNKFRDIDFDIENAYYPAYNQYIDMIIGLASSTITGLKIEIGSNPESLNLDIDPLKYTITANKIMYSFDGWDALINTASTTSLSNIKAKSKIDIQSVGFDVFPPNALMGMDQIFNLIIAKSSVNNIIIKKIQANAEVLNNKLILKSKLDLAIGSANADIQILLPALERMDEAYILNFEIKFTGIDSDIATLIDASMITVGLPIQKTSYGYLYKIVGTLDNPQPVLQ
jgi:hypothetical protein